ncbi:hypothetical protein JQ634_03355 [Bradyrhizobium sp. AUGA SZCCT0240]|jgi:hypothetical protein|uniref:hypothetical protein n=1 Tax=unclassified Bradyrhizobium TaxID=2631580 RepID=UPI001BABD6DA|nr:MULTISPECIES: hypothetical protein [unclassified Bradyrhizobium]MBR1196736.1 hypothetical protein [Bradyrhizobium sp. AUGA SZCCT0158]MBR1241385.1 hypothetical protein [Bradyrhizobium sp. AUGA SZCCT0274]MBR1250227.1 hypothetical protein [Bradyrhizobium sp. AUGA SZCCT0169]MBR1252733.1 hypothetical protein [Bradyrhizobium sp. AUGA SZCCT0240]
MSSLLRVAIIVACVCVQIFGTSAAQSGQFARPLSGKQVTLRGQKAEVAMIADSSKAECSVRVGRFVDQLDKVLSTQNSVDPVQKLFKEYFPLEGCDPDEVVKLCRRSQYFSGITTDPNSFVISFDSRIRNPHSGIYVQFSLDRRSGNSELPFVKIKI